MGMVFKQLAGTAATVLDACNASDHDVAATAKKWGAESDGSTAATQYTLTVPGTGAGAASVVLLAQWESVASAGNDPGLLSVWPEGDWVCRINVSQASANVFWDSVEICALHEDGVTTTAVASKTGIGESLSSTGTYSETITTTSDVAVPQGSTILWSFYFGQTIGAPSSTFKIKSNKNLATPIAGEPPRAGFRPHMGANRMAASSVANRAFARSMLEASGAQAWSFGCAMPERYHIFAMDVTAQTMTQSHVRRERIARAAQRAASIATLSGMERPGNARAGATAFSVSSGAAQRSHTSSGSKAV